jgi:hypothetical protein
MSKKTSLWLIAALMSSILQAHAGRPSSPAPTPAPTPQPQQQPAPANTPDTNPSNPPPANAPQGSDTNNPTDPANTPQSGFLSTTTGQAAVGVGAIGGAGLLSLGGYSIYKGVKTRNSSNNQNAPTADIPAPSSVAVTPSNPQPPAKPLTTALLGLKDLQTEAQIVLEHFNQYPLTNSGGSFNTTHKENAMYAMTHLNVLAKATDLDVVGEIEQTADHTKLAAGFSQLELHVSNKHITNGEFTKDRVEKLQKHYTTKASLSVSKTTYS